MTARHCGGEYQLNLVAIVIGFWKPFWIAKNHMSQKMWCGGVSINVKIVTSLSGWWEFVRLHLQSTYRLHTYLIMVTNCDMVSSCGTKNFVLSRTGRRTSFWYRSTITCKKTDMAAILVVIILHYHCYWSSKHSTFIYSFGMFSFSESPSWILSYWKAYIIVWWQVDAKEIWKQQVLQVTCDWHF